MLLYYPNIVKEFGDNSDQKAVNYPLRRLLKRSFSKPLLSKVKGGSSVINSGSATDYSTSQTPFIKTNLNNTADTAKEFMISYSYRSQPFSKQSVRKYKGLTSYTTNYNLSLGLNSLDSQLLKSRLNTSATTPLHHYNSHKTN
jgi:hypothetical protein